MKTITTLLTALAFCIANVALADDVVIPTTEENPFDLTKGVITSDETHENFTSHGVEWMMDGDKIVYTLQNQQEADFYLASVWLDTGVNGVTVDFNLMNQSGTVVADTTFAIVNQGWHNKNGVYRVKTTKMNKGKYTLTFTFHSTPGNNSANISCIKFETPQTVSIPTTDDNPFDLKKGLVISLSTSSHFTENGVDNMLNDDQLVYALQNESNADYYNVLLDISTDRGGASVDFLLTNQNGAVVADTTLNLVNKGRNNAVTYVVQVRKMTKGKYMLTLTYHWPERNDWVVGYVKSIAFKNPKKLEVGDEVEIENPEFNDGGNSWTSTNTRLLTTSEYYANKIGEFEATDKGSIEQTIYNVPNGLYLVQVNGFDFVSSNNDNREQVRADRDVIGTYLYANSSEVLLKDIFDDALTGQNVYRWYQGIAPGYYTGESSTAFMPNVNGQQPSVLALTYNPYLYINTVVVPVINGKLTFGIRKIDTDRHTWIVFDHFKVTYLSKSTATPAKNGRAYTRQLVDDAIRAAGGSAVSSDTDNAALNRLIALEEEKDRQSYQMLDITVEQPGTLGDEIFGKLGNDFNLVDLKRIRIKGQLNDEDLYTLRDRCTGLIEIDMSKVLNTSFVDGQFRSHYYLRYVKLPDYLETLPNNAFRENYNLNTVVLPASMKQIGEAAFYRCYNLRQAIIPEGVTSMGNDAYNESGLWKVQFSSMLKVIPAGACRYCYELTDIQFNGQTTIKDSYAFEKCTHLRKVTMPSTMEHIYANAFQGCIRLADVQLNEGLIDIWHNAFDNCKALMQLTLPSSVQGLYGCPFTYCDNLQNMICLGVAPPFTMYNLTHDASRSNPFGGREADKNRTISVPYISQNVYKQTAGWDLHNIVTHDQLPKNVYMNMPYNMTWPADLMATWKPNIHITPNAKHTASESGNGGMLTYGQLYVGSKASMSADTLSVYYGFYPAKEADNRKFFTPMLVNGTARADVIVSELCVAKNYWTFFSLPYDVKVSDITTNHPEEPYVIRTYDGKKRADGLNTETWTKITKDSILHAGQGYIIRTTNDVWGQDYHVYYFPSINNGNKTKYFTNQDVTVPLKNYPTEFAHNRSWNFIGNPYPCFFDIRAMQTTSPITIWNRSSNYETYSPLDDDYILNPGQALFIQRPLDQANVIFLKEGRQNDMAIRDTIYYNNVRAMAETQPRQVYNLVLSDGTNSSALDRTRFVINEAATQGYDVSFDASKFFSTEPGTAHLYTIDGDVSYAINERPIGSGEILLGLQLSTAGTYCLALSSKKGSGNWNENTEVWLIDKQENTETLLNEASYTFPSNAGTLNSRFVIRLGGATGVQSVAVSQQQTEQLFDLQGRRISEPQKGIYVKDGQKVVIK
ncbi:MAG: leucine-rich repeat protein [Prevotella sp.]|nr:leucine-rich repeat protein [Prevotella sp.]